MTMRVHRGQVERSGGEAPLCSTRWCCRCCPRGGGKISRGGADVAGCSTGRRVVEDQVRLRSYTGYTTLTFAHRGMLKSLNSCCEKWLKYLVGTFLAMDEISVSFYGRHSLRMFNPNKPNKCVCVHATPLAHTCISADITSRSTPWWPTARSDELTLMQRPVERSLSIYRTRCRRAYWAGCSTAWSLTGST